LDKDEYILPHRNLGVLQVGIFHYIAYSQWQGKANGFTKGRDRSFHFGTQEYKIIGMISHLGPTGKCARKTHKDTDNFVTKYGMNLFVKHPTLVS
jgi:TPP-dependent pyruvate/acetoin dehydrogenase alpha subunit